MLCQKCSERETCQELCIEAELFVNQDHVPQAEYYEPTKNFIGVFTDEYGKSVWDYQKEYYSPKELKRLIEQLYLEGKSTREVAYHLSCSHVYIHKVLTKSKAK